MKFLNCIFDLYGTLVDPNLPPRVIHMYPGNQNRVHNARKIEYFVIFHVQFVCINDIMQREDYT